MGAKELSDYEFLNAMKHGYRISFISGGTINFNKKTVFSADTTLIYYTKKKESLKEHSIMFQHKGMILRLLYALSILENTIEAVNHGISGGAHRKVTSIFPMEKYQQDFARISEELEILGLSKNG